MAIVFFYVQVIHGAIEPARNFWQERRTSTQKLQKGPPAEPPENSPTRVSVPQENTLLAQLPSADLNVLSNSLPKLQEIQQFENTVAPSLTSNHLPATALPANLPPWFQAVPLNHANLREVYIPPSWRSGDLMVIHIQDAHGNAEAQTNIAKVIESLAKAESRDSVEQRGVKSLPSDTRIVVGVEGGRGPFNFHPYRSFPDPEITGDIAQYFLKESLITGPEYAGMTLGLTGGREPPVLFWGVEDDGLYLKHVQAFKDSIGLQKRAEAVLSRLNDALNQLKAQKLNPALRELDDKISRHHKGQLGLGSYVKSLTGHGRTGGKTIQQFVTAFTLEESLDYKQAEKERGELTRALSEKLPGEELKNLVTASLSYRLGNLNHSAFYRYLKELCGAYGIQLSRWPAMDRYIRYVLISEKIKPEELFEEIQNLEKKALKALVKSPEEEALMGLSEDMALIEKLVHYGLSPAEWGIYESRKYQIRDVAGRIEKFPGNASPDLGGGESSEPLGRLMEHFEKFNEAAIARDAVLTNNFLKKVTGNKREDNANAVGILITGGFHTEGMTKLLREKKIAYVVLMPRLGKVEGSGTEYLDLFHRDKTPLEKLFTGERITLNPTPGMTQNPPDGIASTMTAVQEREFTSLSAVKALLKLLKTHHIAQGRENKEFRRLLASNLVDWMKQAGFVTVHEVEFGDLEVVWSDDGSTLRQVTLPIVISGSINGKTSVTRTTLTVSPEKTLSQSDLAPAAVADVGPDRITISQSEPGWIQRLSDGVGRLKSVLARAWASMKQNLQNADYKSLAAWQSKNLWWEDAFLIVTGVAAIAASSPFIRFFSLGIFIALHVPNISADWKRTRLKAALKGEPDPNKIVWVSSYVLTLVAGAFILQTALLSPALAIQWGASTKLAGMLVWVSLGAFLSHAPYSRMFLKTPSIRMGKLVLGVAPLMVLRTAEDPSQELIDDTSRKVMNNEDVTIAFVCTANITRSAFCHIQTNDWIERQARRRRIKKSKVSVISGGVDAGRLGSEDKPFLKDYKKVLAANKISADEMENFKSRQISKDELISASIIVVADRSVRDAILGMFADKDEEEIRAKIAKKIVFMTDFNPKLKELYGDKMPDPEGTQGMTVQKFTDLIFRTIVLRLYPIERKPDDQPRPAVPADRLEDLALEVLGRQSADKKRSAEILGAISRSLAWNADQALFDAENHKYKSNFHDLLAFLSDENDPPMIKPALIRRVIDAYQKWNGRRSDFEGGDEDQRRIGYGLMLAAYLGTGGVDDYDMARVRSEIFQILHTYFGYAKGRNAYLLCIMAGLCIDSEPSTSDLNKLAWQILELTLAKNTPVDAGRFVIRRLNGGAQGHEEFLISRLEGAIEQISESDEGLGHAAELLKALAQHLPSSDFSDFTRRLHERKEYKKWVLARSVAGTVDPAAAPSIPDFKESDEKRLLLACLREGLPYPLDAQKILREVVGSKGNSSVDGQLMVWALKRGVDGVTSKDLKDLLNDYFEQKRFDDLNNTLALALQLRVGDIAPEEWYRWFNAMRPHLKSGRFEQVIAGLKNVRFADDTRMKEDVNGQLDSGIGKFEVLKGLLESEDDVGGQKIGRILALLNGCHLTPILDNASLLGMALALTPNQFVKIAKKLDELSRAFEKESRVLYEDDRSNNNRFTHQYLHLAFALEMLFPGSIDHILDMLNDSPHPRAVLEFLDSKRKALENEGMFSRLVIFAKQLRTGTRDIDTLAKSVDIAVRAMNQSREPEFYGQIEKYSAGAPVNAFLNDLLMNVVFREIEKDFDLEIEDPKIESIQSIDMSRLSKLVDILKSLSLQRKTRRDLVRETLSAMLRDGFWDFIEDLKQESEIGRALARHNAKVSEAMRSVGINVEGWLGREVQHRLEPVTFLSAYVQDWTEHDPSVYIRSVNDSLLRVLNLSLASDTATAIEEGIAGLDLKIEWDIRGKEAGGKALLLRSKYRADRVDLINVFKDSKKLGFLREKVEKARETLRLGETEKARELDHLLRKISDLEEILDQKTEDYLALRHSHKQFSVRPIQRRPGHDLLLEYYTQGEEEEHPDAMLMLLADEGMNGIEVVDESNGNTVAFAKFYIDQDGNLVIHKMAIIDEYERIMPMMNMIGHEMINYADRFREHINAKQLLLGISKHNPYLESGFVQEKNRFKRIDYEKDKIGGYFGEEYRPDSAKNGSAYLVSGGVQAMVIRLGDAVFRIVVNGKSDIAFYKVTAGGIQTPVSSDDIKDYLYDTINVNRRDEITWEEFFTSILPNLKWDLAEIWLYEGINKAEFKRLDLNGDGELDKHEVKKMSVEEVANLLQKLSKGLSVRSMDLIPAGEKAGKVEVHVVHRRVGPSAIFYKYHLKWLAGEKLNPFGKFLAFLGHPVWAGLWENPIFLGSLVSLAKNLAGVAVFDPTGVTWMTAAFVIGISALFMAIHAVEQNDFSLKSNMRWFASGLLFTAPLMFLPAVPGLAIGAVVHIAWNLISSKESQLLKENSKIEKEIAQINRIRQAAKVDGQGLLPQPVRFSQILQGEYLLSLKSNGGNPDAGERIQAARKTALLAELYDLKSGRESDTLPENLTREQLVRLMPYLGASQFSEAMRQFKSKGFSSDPWTLDQAAAFVRSVLVTGGLARASGERRLDFNGVMAFLSQVLPGYTVSGDKARALWTEGEKLAAAIPKQTIVNIRDIDPGREAPDFSQPLVVSLEIPSSGRLTPAQTAKVMEMKKSQDAQKKRPVFFAVYSADTGVDVPKVVAELRGKFGVQAGVLDSKDQTDPGTIYELSKLYVQSVTRQKQNVIMENITEHQIITTANGLLFQIYQFLSQTQAVLIRIEDTFQAAELISKQA